MEDCEIVQCVAATVGHCGAGATIEQLGGRQGLLVCRVVLPETGSFVFKAVRQSAARELALTACIAQRCPAAVPEVLAYEEDRKRGLYFMVVRDLGSRRLADSPTPAAYSAAAETLARVQLSLLDSPNSLEQIGIPIVTTARWEEIGLAVAQAME